MKEIFAAKAEGLAETVLIRYRPGKIDVE